jgi:hypothetical protein
MFGSKGKSDKNDKNDKVRQQLEHDGGQRAWAVILDYHSRYGTGRYSVVPKDMVDHAKLTLRVEPEGQAPFEATAQASFAHHFPRSGGSIGVIFDPRDPSKIAICPEWSFAPESVGKPRTLEMIAAFLTR